MKIFPALSLALPRPQKSLEKNSWNLFLKRHYATSEMIMDAFMHLRKAGILKREIFDLDEEKKRLLHGASFLGSKEFYSWLRELPPIEAEGIGMTLLEGAASEILKMARS